MTRIGHTPGGSVERLRPSSARRDCCAACYSPWILEQVKRSRRAAHFSRILEEDDFRAGRDVGIVFGVTCILREGSRRSCWMECAVAARRVWVPHQGRVWDTKRSYPPPRLSHPQEDWTGAVDSRRNARRRLYERIDAVPSFESNAWLPARVSAATNIRSGAMECRRSAAGGCPTTAYEIRCSTGMADRSRTLRFGWAARPRLHALWPACCRNGYWCAGCWKKRRTRPSCGRALQRAGAEEKLLMNHRPRLG